MIQCQVNASVRPDIVVPRVPIAVPKDSLEKSVNTRAYVSTAAYAITSLASASVAPVSKAYNVKRYAMAGMARIANCNANAKMAARVILLRAVVRVLLAGGTHCARNRVLMVSTVSTVHKNATAKMKQAVTR